MMALDFRGDDARLHLMVCRPFCRFYVRDMICCNTDIGAAAKCTNQTDAIATCL